MVRFVQIFVFIAAAELLPTSDLLPSISGMLEQSKTKRQLALEFSKRSIHAGELVQAHFVLYSNRAFEEIEVSRFPEFDGFWTENTALKQGRVILSQFGFNQYKVTIGTYAIIPLAKRDNSKVEPMSLVMRDTSQVIQSVGQPLVIKKLPYNSLGPQTTAVGILQLNSDTSYSFWPEQPSNLRITIHGEGNFPEIEAPHLNFPSEIELLTVRASMMGTGAFNSKTFEYTFVVHGKEPITLSRNSFWYFNTQLTKYQEIPIPAFKLVPIDIPNIESATPPATKTPERTLRGDIWNHPLVILMNLLFFAFLGYIGIWKRRRTKKVTLAMKQVAKSETVKSPPIPAQEPPDWNGEFNSAVAKGDNKKALKILIDWIEFMIWELTRYESKRPISRQELFQAAKHTVNSETLKSLMEILEDCDRVVYGNESQNPSQLKLRYFELSKFFNPTKKTG